MRGSFLRLNYTVVFDLVFAAGALVFIVKALAQTPPQLIVTWSADGYAPASFAGKVLPTSGSLVSVAVEALDKNKIADLSQKEIRWFLDENRFEKGVGLKAFSFVASAPPQGEHVLRVSVKEPGGEIFRTVRIPVAGPEVAVIKRRTGENTFVFKALPYFFNFKDIYKEGEFSWNANGQLAAGDDREPDVLILEVPAGTPAGETISIEAAVKNAKRPLELAKNSFSFTFVR